MLKKVVGGIKDRCKKLYSSGKKIPLTYYFFVFLAALVFLANQLYLWQKKELNFESHQNGSAADTVINKTDDFTIYAPQKNGSMAVSKKIRGVSDSGFENSFYVPGKNMLIKNADVKISDGRVHSGSNSLEIVWKNTSNNSVLLKDLLEAEKNGYFKLGLWISSEKSGDLGLSLMDSAGKTQKIAAANIVSDPEKNFIYYEYNFKSSLDATGLLLSVPANETASDIFIDDISFWPLNVQNETELSSVRVAASGSSRKNQPGESQTAHEKDNGALAVPGTRLGQVFTSHAENLTGAAFFLTKAGDGGVGDYTVELKNFDENSDTLSTENIATAPLPSNSVENGMNIAPIFAKLEPGKKYWVGLDNSGVQVDQSNYLFVGTARANGLYLEGTGFSERGNGSIDNEENDLVFATYHAAPAGNENGYLAYGAMLYDLGGGRERAVCSLDPSNGSDIIDIYDSNGISIDKWRNILLTGNDSYIVYRFHIGQKSLSSFALENLSFHNNINVAISNDGKSWTDAFSDNSGQKWQNSGEIKADVSKKAQDIFVRIKKNGEDNSFFMGGYVTFNLN